MLRGPSLRWPVATLMAAILSLGAQPALAFGDLIDMVGEAWSDASTVVDAAEAEAEGRDTCAPTQHILACEHLLGFDSVVEWLDRRLDGDDATGDRVEQLAQGIIEANAKRDPQRRSALGAVAKECRSLTSGLGHRLDVLRKIDLARLEYLHDNLLLLELERAAFPGPAQAVMDRLTIQELDERIADGVALHAQYADWFDQLVSLCASTEEALAAYEPGLSWVRDVGKQAQVAIDLPTGFTGTLDPAGALHVVFESTTANGPQEYTFHGTFRLPGLLHADAPDTGDLRVISERKEGGSVPVRVSLCFTVLKPAGIEGACAEAGQPGSEPYRFPADSLKTIWRPVVPPPGEEGDELVIRVHTSVGAYVDFRYVAERDLQG